ncbi:MAG TPA: TRAP transporter small permease subunit, partial [Xanthobacteraceae bacterium]|nr:TRAP transporter small permease subunit [Xanthobacteraceae bacterium]
NATLGRYLSGLVWGIAIVCAIVVVLRYVFLMSFTWMQELYVWIHAVVFLTAASFAMLVNAHVRVDILYNRWSLKTRAIVEILGAVIFTLPWLIVLGLLTWPYVLDSWKILEGSAQPNGMPGVYLFKTLLLVFCVLMTLQCLAIVARGILALTGDKDAANTPPYAVPSGHTAEAKK